MSDGSAICWPEQYPGERKAFEKWWSEMDKKYPGRNVDCCHWNSDYYPCHHCQVCKKFISGITAIIYEAFGIAAIYGTCKDHGRQFVDRTNWDYEHFGADL